MSALFNQTNVAPGTTFSGGGSSGASFPDGLNVSLNGVNTTYMQIDPSAYWSQPILAFENSDTNVGSGVPVLASEFFAFSWDGSTLTTQKSGTYASDTIMFQGNSGSGDNSVFLKVRDAGLNSTPQDLSFAMSCVSSMQSGAFQINAEKMCSTMKGYGWA